MSQSTEYDHLYNETLNRREAKFDDAWLDNFGEKECDDDVVLSNEEMEAVEVASGYFDTSVEDYESGFNIEYDGLYD